MKKVLLIFIGIFGFAGVAFALPYFSSQGTLIPNNNTQDLGTTTAPTGQGSLWRTLYVNTASTTNLTVSSLGGSSGCLTANSNGTITTTACSAGSGVAYSFTPGTYGTLSVSATSTALQDFAGLISATSTIGALSATSSFSTLFVTGTQCLHSVNGAVSGTGSDCGAGGGGGTGAATSSFAATLPLLLTTSVSAITYSTLFTTTTNTGIGNNLSLYTSNSGVLLGVATSSGTVSSPLTGNFVCVGSGCTLGIQAASASQNGYLALGDYQLLHTATTTFTSPLIYTGSTNAVTCQTADVSHNGCLTSGDWGTFNGKQATISATWPITLTGAAVGFNGLSTSSPIAAGANVLYATGVNTLASAATGTISGSTGLSVTAGQSIIGSGLTITNTGVTSNVAGSGITVSGATGAVTISALFGFTQGTNFNQNENATGTLIWFKGTPISLAASSTSWFDQINVGSSTSASLATSTFFGNLVVGGHASTSQLTVSNGGGTGTRCAQFDAVGRLSGAAAACGTGGFAFPWTPATNYNANSNGTSTALWLQGSPYSLFASSTAVLTYASTTLISAANLVSGNCVQASTGGMLVTTGSACGAGGGSGTLQTETPSGTINSSNTVFTTTNQPALVELNGAYQTAGGVDYTLTGSGPYTITFVNAPVTGSNLISLYGNAANTAPWPFTVTDTNFNVAVQSTSTPLWFKTPVSGIVSLMASSTAVLTYASTTALSASNLVSGNCVQASTGGMLTTTGSACGAGGGGGIGDPFSHPFLGWSATTSSMALGTSTPSIIATLTLASSTASQLALGDGLQTTNDSIFHLRSVGNFLYLATSSPSNYATSTPFIFAIASSSSMWLPERAYATSTSMNVDWYAGNQQRINYGTSAVTVTFTDIKDGASLTLTTCNPGATGGALTFSTAHFSGGVQPGNTTTSNQCDMWFFRGTMATGTTPIAVLTGMVSGIQ